MLYREPKLLKERRRQRRSTARWFVSVLYREPKLLKGLRSAAIGTPPTPVSVLYREPKLLKDAMSWYNSFLAFVSVLYREPKLLKAALEVKRRRVPSSFSALP